MQYQPFLIAPFKSGLNTDIAPWMLPADAFQNIENAYLKNGVINKRGGMQFFAQFVNNVGLTTNQITGIYNYVGLSSGEKESELLFTDTVRMCRYNPATEVCNSIDVTDIFASSNYKWFANYGITGSVTQNRLFITDNDSTGAPPATPMRTYTFGAATTSDFLPKYGAAATDVVRTCLMIFPIKNRLVLLNTVEDSGTPLRKPQRARWCVAGNPSTTANQWRQDIPGNGGFVDAPTADFIIGAAALQDYIIVFFSNSTWSLRPTSDPALPFRWDRINNFRSCDATYSVINHDRYAISFGRNGIVACDGIEVKRIDDNIQEFVTNVVDQDNIEMMYSARDYSLKRSWTAFNSAGKEDSAENDSVLVRSDDDGSWSIYDVKMSCMGTGNSPKDFTLADFTGNYDWDFEHFTSESFLSFYSQQGSNLFLGGDYDGNIYILEYGASDDTADTDDLPIDMTVLSAGLNPFKDQGVEAQLGYVDIYADQSVQGKLTVSFFQDDNPSPFTSETVNLIPEINWLTDILDVALTNPCSITAISHGITTGTQVFIYGVDGTSELNTGPYTVTNVGENTFTLDGVDATGYTAYTGGGVVLETPLAFENAYVWKRVYSGAIGYLHQIQIESSGANQDIRIHAIKPWFRQTGSRQLS